MKMFFVIVVSLALLARSAYSQGYVDFNNLGTGSGLAPVTITTQPGAFNPANGTPGA